MATRQRVCSSNGGALISISNFFPGEELSYSLPLLVGEVCPPVSQGSIVVKNAASKSSLSWPIRNGLFKALVPLQPGSNLLSLHFFDDHLDFELHLTPPARPFFVRPVLIRTKDDEGSIQGPPQEDTSAKSAQQRIALGARRSCSPSLQRRCTNMALGEKRLHLKAISTLNRLPVTSSLPN
jgi:hypothetical protein